jgi:hypothetical protein
MGNNGENMKTLSVILFLLCAARAEDGTQDANLYMSISWNLAQSSYDKQEKALIDSLTLKNAACTSNAMKMRYALLISVCDTFLTKSTDYIETLKNGGKSFDKTILLGQFSTYNTQFVAKIPTQNCGHDFGVDKPTTTALNEKFDVAKMEIFAMLSTSSVKPISKAVNHSSESNLIDLLGRDFRAQAAINIYLRQ